MSKQPQLPLAETVKKKLTAEQKVRLNQLIEAFAQKGDVLNFYPSHINTKPIDTTHEDYDEKIGKMLQEFRDALPKEIIDPITEFGLTPDDIPALAVIVNSDKLYHHRQEKYNFAVLHASLALSALQDPTAIAVLINQLYKAEMYDDDDITEFYPSLITNFGESAIEPLLQANQLCKAGTAKSIIIQCLTEIASEHPSVMAVVKGYLIEQLKNYAQQDDMYNGMLVGYMANLAMIDQLPLIAEAYAQRKIDPTYMGDMEDIEIEFGVRTERDTPRPKYRPNDPKLAESLDKLAMLYEHLGNDDEFAQKPLVESIQRQF